MNLTDRKKKYIECKSLSKDLQVEIDFLLLKKKKLDNDAYNYRCIEMTLGDLKNKILSGAIGNSTVYINYKDSEFHSRTSVNLSNNSVKIGGYEKNDNFRDDNSMIVVLIEFDDIFNFGNYVKLMQ